MNKLFRILPLLPALLLASLSAALAQAYPNKPVRLVVPYNPGGFVDYIGRTVAQHLSEPLGQQVVVENRPGAGGIAGTDVVARSAPDGYSLVIMDPAIIINPTLQPSMPFDFFKQLETVSMVSTSPLVLVTTPKIPVTNMNEFLAYLKANSGKVNFASAGVGTTPHLSGEMLKQRLKVDATHVPYRSIGNSYPDIISGKVQFAFSSIAGALPFTSDNRVTAIATTGERRSNVYPNLPTVVEAGLSGFVVDAWLGLFAPAGLPADVRQKLTSALDVALKNNELKAAFAKVGNDPRFTTSQEAASFVKSEFEKWKKIIVDGNIKEN